MAKRNNKEPLATVPLNLPIQPIPAEVERQKRIAENHIRMQEALGSAKSDLDKFNALAKAVRRKEHRRSEQKPTGQPQPVRASSRRHQRDPLPQPRFSSRFGAPIAPGLRDDVEDERNFITPENGATPTWQDKFSSHPKTAASSIRGQVKAVVDALTNNLFDPDCYVVDTVMTFIKKEVLYEGQPLPAGLCCLIEAVLLAWMPLTGMVD
jgi:hypothetical protein